VTVSAAFLVKDPPVDRLALLLEYLRPVVSEFCFAVDERTLSENISWLFEESDVHIKIIPWKDDFSWARNQGLELVTGDWTLILDPDELPSAWMLSHIRWVDMYGDSAHLGPETLGFLYWTKNFYDGRLYPDDPKYWHCRLFRSGHGRFYKKLHEQVELDGLPEHVTRGTPKLTFAPREAYLIHSKTKEDYNKSVDLQAHLGEVSM